MTSPPLESVMGPKSIMYIEAFTALTAEAPLQPRADPDQLVLPAAYELNTKLAAKPRERAEPTRGAAGQDVQLELEVAPTTDEKVPKGHVDVHVWDVSPGEAPQVPAGHGVQNGEDAPPMENEPGGHRLVHAAV